jgi:hypothetical protein
MRTLVLAFLFASACAGSVAPTAGSDEGALAEGTPDALGVLGFLNGADATLSTLDVTVGLDKRAAANIVAHIAGPDGTRGTADDHPLDTVAELDAIPYVGASAIAKLQAYVEAQGLVPNQVVEGVALTAAQAAAILTVADEATLAQLDSDAGLDSRAAANIVAARPFTDLSALAAVKYVGKTALEHLRDYAPRFQPSGCYLALADSLDQNASDLTELLALATTIDTPAYEIVAVHVTGCPNAPAPANQAKLAAALEARVNWRVTPLSAIPFVIDPLEAGDAGFVSELAGAKQIIGDNVSEGTWSPSSSAEGAALYARLPALLAALTPDASGVDELRIDLVADECSQRMVAWIDLRTLEVRIIHRFSEC